MSTTSPRLVVLSGRLKGRIYEISGPTILGRVKGVTIQVPDSKVSREHSKLFLQGGETIVVDLNSSNGTQVNDAKVTRHVLHDGDELLVGETRFRYEAPGAAASTAPAQTTPGEKPAPTTEPRVTSAPVRQVEDLAAKAAATRTTPRTPAGATRSDQIHIKDHPLQFSKHQRGKTSFINDDLGQRPLGYQLLMGVIVLAVSIGFLVGAMYVAGMIGGK